MPRLFDGTDDKVTVAVGNAGFAFGPGTIAMLIRRNNTAVSQRPFMRDTAGTGRLGLRVNSTDDLSVQIGNVLQVGPLKLDATGWWLAAVTKASGAQLPRSHTYKYATGVFSHTDHGATVANSATSTASPVLGANNTTEFFNGDIAVAGLFDVALTDQQIEALAYSLSAWRLPNSVGRWLLNQSATAHQVIDETGGGANQSAIVGTAIGTAHLPLFNWDATPLLITRQPTAAGTTLSPASLVRTRALGSLTVSPTIPVASLVHTRALGGPTVSGEAPAAGQAPLVFASHYYHWA